MRQTKYEWLYVIGAVCPQTGKSSGLLSPYINAEIMNIYLQQFSKELAEDVQAVVIHWTAGLPNIKFRKTPIILASIVIVAIGKIQFANTSPFFVDKKDATAF